MESKISFFNKTVFFKNIRRFWLLPAGFLFCYIWAMPVIIYFSYSEHQNMGLAEDLRRTILGGYLILSLVYAIGAGLITATVVFLYLQRQASVNFFHSLPSDRREMFTTNLLSGFAMIFVPVIITDFITILVCGSIGANMVKELLAWLLVTLIMAAFFYLFAVICVLLSGQMWFSSSIYAIFLIYLIGIIALVTFVISMLNVGCQMDFWLPDGIWGILSPVTFFGIAILRPDVNDSYHGTGKILSEMSLELITASVATAAFVIIAYLLYKYRHSEAAGDTIAFGFAKPIFRWGFAFSLGLLLTVIMLATVNAGHDGAKVLMVIFMIIFGVLGFILAQMLVKKSVHIFKMKSETHKTFGIKAEMCCFAVIMLIAGIIVVIVANKVNTYVPSDADDVEKLRIMTNYGYNDNEIVDKKVISEVIALHREIVDDLDDNKDIYDGYEAYDYDNATYIEIVYNMQNDRRVSRHYFVPDNSRPGKHLKAMLSDPDFILKLSFGDVKKADISAAYILTNGSIENQSVATYYKDASALYEAMMADVGNGAFDAGDLFTDRYLYEIEDKEFGYYDDGGEAVKGYTKVIPFEYINVGELDGYGCTVVFSNLSPDTVYSKGHTYYCVHLNSRCTHMLEVMKMCTWMK